MAEESKTKIVLLIMRTERKTKLGIGMLKINNYVDTYDIPFKNMKLFLMHLSYDLRSINEVYKEKHF